MQRIAAKINRTPFCNIRYVNLIKIITRGKCTNAYTFHVFGNIYL